MLVFSIYDENKVIVENSFKTMASPGACDVFSTPVLERNTEVSLILLFYKVVYISIRLVCRVCGNALEKFAVKFAKNADLYWSKSHEL